ncbi:MAG: hypothetical protein WC502_09115, partial [Methanolinea sp.]
EITRTPDEPGYPLTGGVSPLRTAPGFPRRRGPLLLLLIDSRHPPDRRGFTPPDRPWFPRRRGPPPPPAPKTFFTHPSSIPPYMVMHECGYEQEILCRRCGTPLSYKERTGLYCPKCGHEITLLCPACGKKW